MRYGNEPVRIRRRHDDVYDTDMTPGVLRERRPQAPHPWTRRPSPSEHKQQGTCPSVPAPAPSAGALARVATRPLSGPRLAPGNEPALPCTVTPRTNRRPSKPHGRPQHTPPPSPSLLRHIFLSSYRSPPPLSGSPDSAFSIPPVPHSVLYILKPLQVDSCPPLILRRSSHPGHR